MHPHGPPPQPRAGQQLVTTTNSGNITANALQLSASDNNNNAALKAGLNVKIESWSGPNESGTLGVVFDGLLSSFESNPIGITGPVGPGQTDPFYVTFYATDLPAGAQGGTVVPRITVTYQG